MELTNPRDALRAPALDEDPRARFDDAVTKLHGATLSTDDVVTAGPAAEARGATARTSSDGIAQAGPEDLDPPDDGPDPDLRPGGRPSPFRALKELGSQGGLYRF